jgi:uncharacterized Zn-binding protein involved in type VI secretion
MHVCPMVTGIVPHVGGPIVTGCYTVLTGSMPQARISDMCVCVGPPDVIVVGAFTVIVGGMPAARIGDNTAHGGVIVTGLPTVLIGDSGAGGGGGGGGGPGGSGGGAFNVPVAGQSGDPTKGDDDSWMASLGTVASALPSPAAQAQALIAAAESGVPFVERCMDAASSAARKLTS